MWISTWDFNALFVILNDVQYFYFYLISDCFSVMIVDHAAISWTLVANALLSQQGLHPMHLCAEQNRSDLNRGTWHHLQGAPLCTHLSPPPLELRWPAGEDVGLPSARAHVRVVIQSLQRVITSNLWLVQTADFDGNTVCIYWQIH